MGANWGINGTGKIKFGEIGIERIYILEPYIEDKYFTKKNVSIKLENVTRDYCYINFSTKEKKENIKNSFELTFVNENNYELYFQCTFSYKYTENICFHKEAKEKYDIDKGVFLLHKIQSLGTENAFHLEKNFSFIHYGNDEFVPLYKEDIISKFYISEAGSTFIFAMYNCSNCQFLHHFYPNNSKKPLKDCNEIKFNNLINLKDSHYKKLI